MCDCLFGDCCWLSFGNVGFAFQCLSCGCWFCKPQLMNSYNRECCACWETSGIGLSMGCVACMCCIPKWLQLYSFQVNNSQPYGYGYGPGMQYPMRPQNPVMYY